MFAQEIAKMRFSKCNQIRVKVDSSKTDEEIMRSIATILVDNNFDIQKYIPEIGYMESGSKEYEVYSFKVDNGYVTIYGKILDTEGNYSEEIKNRDFITKYKPFEQMDKFAHLLGSNIEYLKVDTK